MCQDCDPEIFKNGTSIASGMDDYGSAVVFLEKFADAASKEIESPDAWLRIADETIDIWNAIAGVEGVEKMNLKINRYLPEVVSSPEGSFAEMEKHPDGSYVNIEEVAEWLRQQRNDIPVTGEEMAAGFLYAVNIELTRENT